MDVEPLLLMLVAFVAEASLLWVAAELGVLAAGRKPAVARVAAGVSVLLIGCGLWWPGRAMLMLAAAGAAAAGPGRELAFSVLGAGVLSLLVVGAREALRYQKKVALAASLMLLPIVGCLYAMIVFPGLFRAPKSGGLASGWLAVLLMCAALVVSQLSWKGRRYATYWRAAAACTAAAMAVWGLVASGVAQARRIAMLWPDGLLLGCVVGLAVALLWVARQMAAGMTDAAVRPARAAVVDNLTRLPTRLFFESRLVAAADVCTARETKLAVFFIDLDGFKPINDTFGHSTGDRVLEKVGKRLRKLIRGEGVASRVGGDEFLFMATEVSTTEDVGRLAEHLITVLSQPYKVDEREVSISCSVGVAMFPDSCSPGKLVARADAAMYSAKRAGGSRYCFYSREMDADVQQNFDTLRDLRQALVGNELELFFQPKIDARSGKVTAAEALIRWHHPTRGLLQPTEFIPLAERSGLIGALGNWVIEAAFKQAHGWREHGLRMRVAINLSTYQMRQDDIADRIGEALSRYRIHPSLLTCEITESAAMEDTAATQETFRRLGELGVHLSIDDFGTGYSSLAYLRQLPAEELKIDASFVNDIENSPDARAVVDAVVKLAHALGLKVVAEGVENQRQHQILVELGCDELQGFLFAKPMSARALLLWAVSVPPAEALAFRESLFDATRGHSMQSEHSSRGEFVAEARNSVV